MHRGYGQNREGHAAKVYFNSLFGKGFSRDDMSSVNAALNYGYGILLSNFNKEIVADGYLTQLGIKHINEYNPFNLTCDLMEPFRVLVDEIVYNNIEKTFDKDFKLLLVDVLNKKVMYVGVNTILQMQFRFILIKYLMLLNMKVLIHQYYMNLHEFKIYESYGTF